MAVDTRHFTKGRRCERDSLSLTRRRESFYSMLANMLLQEGKHVRRSSICPCRVKELEIKKCLLREETSTRS